MKNKNLLVIVLLALLVPMQIFAADVPTILVEYIETIKTMLVDYVMGIVILVMLGTAGYQMYENGNARPIKWAFGAAIVIGGSSYFGDSLMAYANDAYSSLTGAAASTTTS